MEVSWKSGISIRLLKCKLQKLTLFKAEKELLNRY